MLLQLTLLILIQYCHVIYSDSLFDSTELKNDINFTIKISKLNDYRVVSEAWNGLVLYSRATVTTDGKKTGWYKLDTWINPNISNEVTSYSVGSNEGSLLTKVTSQYFHNTMKTFCENRKKICDKIKDLIKENTKWVQGMIKKYKNTDPYWWQVHLLYRQFEGIVKGYKEEKAKKEPKLTAEDFLFMNMQEEVYELAEKFSDEKSLPKKLQEGHCSAIIKLLPKNADLLVSHAAWDGYNTMTRFAKKYDQPFKLLPKSKKIIPGKLITFSSYPSLIHSNDDFYTTSTGLSVMETTIGNYNNKLWKYVTPKGIVFEFIRVMVANRLATDGKSWTKIFSKYNSGTYNNQWMIVDYNKFTPGKSPKKGLLWILEQIPGHIKAEDQTELLKKTTYWPSYNTPYYKNIFNLSGNDKLVKRYGEWFSYKGAPRAKLFKRDHKKVKCVHTLMELMRSNNFKHDEFSKCKCKPPYSATNAIASRNDLNPKNGSYPFPLLGFRPSGATDAKITNSTLIKNQYFLAVAGPTTGTNLPIFKWSTCDFRDKVPHLGQPDEWNFQPQLITWI